MRHRVDVLQCTKHSVFLTLITLKFAAPLLLNTIAGKVCECKTRSILSPYRQCIDLCDVLYSVS